MSTHISIILTATRNCGIELQKKSYMFPDLEEYININNSTTHNVIIDDKTWKSICNEPNIDNSKIIVCTNINIPNVQTADSLENAIKLSNNNIFIIGNCKLITEAYTYSDTIYLAQILDDLKSDVFITPIPDNFQLIKTGKIITFNEISYQFLTYKIKHPEYQYLDLCKKILTTGNLKNDRTNVGTYSIFGASTSWNLQKDFPLFTTKKVNFTSITQELLWFISGNTNSKILSDKGIKIWDGNTSREYLDKMGFIDRKEGDIGPGYGFQWRHWGEDYKDMESKYAGIDQLQHCIDTIKNNPNDRRIIMSAWNVSDISKMSLPPCHCFVQFYVNDGKLNSIMYQRSCDMGLGVPYNVASYALLTLLIADVCNLTAGTFTHMMGDTHIYKSHLEAINTQLQRTPHPFPKIQITHRERIDDFTFEDIKLIDYVSHNFIKMEMAV